jgi:hypothetical protein
VASCVCSLHTISICLHWADKRYHKMLYRVHHAWAGIKLSTLTSLIDTDCIGNYKSIYDTIMTTTIPSIPVLPDFSFDITLFGVLTANYRKLCVRAQCKQIEIVWREHTHDATCLLKSGRTGMEGIVVVMIVS